MPEPDLSKDMGMKDFERIAGIIRYLDRHARQQPSLDQLAQVAQLSSSHLHRLFTRWAGVTPKDFLQALTLEHARSLLRQGSSVCAAAWESGLSGPSRLYDLSVSLLAATPGECKAQGAGWEIGYGFAQSPFGAMLAAEGPRGLVHLSFCDAGAENAALAQLFAEWPRALFRETPAEAAALAERLFLPQPKASVPTGLRALVRGTAFQVRVWRALLELPAGSLTSYSGLANHLGLSQGARAVGGAVARNSLAFLIPCHRVIRETGVCGEYRWGAERKRALLAWESAKQLGAHAQHKSQPTRTR